MRAHFGMTDWVVLAAYVVLTIGAGLALSRQSRTSEGMTSGNRSLPGWVCGLSIFATYLSSISFLALPGKSFSSNWNPFVFSLSLPLAAWAASRWFVPLYRRSTDVSAYARLETQFGPWARVYASLCYLLTQAARIGAVTYLMALPLSLLMGIDIRLVILFTGMVVTAYAFIGGVVAVIWTDAIQAVVLVSGALLCLSVMLGKIPGGIGGVVETAEQTGKFSLGSFDLTAVGESTFWVVLVYGLFINLQNFGVDQSYVQRYIASSSGRQARRGLWLGGMLYLPVSAVFLFMGTALFAFYQAHPADLDEVGKVVAAAGGEAGQKEIGDKALPYFIGKHLPAGVTGLLVAAIFAAGMSTVSTSLNSSATLVLSDYYRRFLNPGCSEKAALNVLRGATLLWGLVGTGVAMLLVKMDSALDAWWTLSGIFSGGILGLFLLGVLSRNTRKPAAVTAVTAGILVIAWLVFSKQDGWPPALGKNPLHSYLVIVLGTLTILLTGIALTSLGRRPERDP